MEQLDQPYLLDSILAPINSGFAASLARYVEVRRRHPSAEMLMGIGNLTELTEADTTGVTALLIGFCQEVGIGAVLTTEVIGWARGAVARGGAGRADHAPRPAPGAAAQAHRLRARHEPGRVDARPLRAGAARDAGPGLGRQLSAVRRRRMAVRVQRRAVRARERTCIAVFDQLDVDDAAHAFYLGKELMKATIARGLRKSYRQEGPLDWGLLSFPEPRREDPR